VHFCCNIFLLYSKFSILVCSSLINPSFYSIMRMNFSYYSLCFGFDILRALGLRFFTTCLAAPFYKLLEGLFTIPEHIDCISIGSRSAISKVSLPGCYCLIPNIGGISLSFSAKRASERFGDKAANDITSFSSI
jgi:hypothetical protein